MVSNASNFVEGVDWVFKLIIGTGIFFLVLITAAMIYFVIRYNRKRHPKAEQIRDYLALEITWITIPAILVIFMFFYGFAAYQPMLWVPKNAMQIKVTGRMWQWSFEYPGNKESTVLVVPLNKPVKLNLYSADVIHGFSIPAFRVKQDVVPGKDNYMWFRAERLGEYEVFCTAYCGLRHAYMGTQVRVVSEADFEKWLAGIVSNAADPVGLQVIRKNGCVGCHSLDGSKMVSVTFKGLYGKSEKVLTGGTERQVTVDDEYLRTSVFDPDKDIVSGYPKGVMKSYKGIITDDEMNKGIEYLKTIK
jgi:cytochrome c oxidase subunit II